MGVSVNIKEEALYSKEVMSLFLTVPDGPVSVGDVLKEKINQTLLQQNGGRNAKGGLQESTLTESYRALKQSFEANGFVILVDDVQIESLDEKIAFSNGTVITLLKLVPLVGG